MRHQFRALFRAAALALGLCLWALMPGPAHALEVRVKGQWDFAYGWVGNMVFKDSINRSDVYSRTRSDRDDDNFQATQRLRTQIDFIASESLRGVLMFEIQTDWGRDGDYRRYENNDRQYVLVSGTEGGRLDADGVNIRTKRAYIDWLIPERKYPCAWAYRAWPCLPPAWAALFLTTTWPV